jgi:hypothetical protein
MPPASDADIMSGGTRIAAEVLAPTKATNDMLPTIVMSHAIRLRSGVKCYLIFDHLRHRIGTVTPEYYTARRETEPT